MKMRKSKADSEAPDNVVLYSQSMKNEDQLENSRLKRTTLLATMRRKNQLTIPREAAEALGISEGDTVVVEIGRGALSLRPVRRSYAGIASGVYGEGAAFVRRERNSWE